MQGKAVDPTPDRSPSHARPPVLSPADSKAHLLAILDTAVEGIIIIDDQGIIERYNRAAQQMFGYEPAEVIGRDVSILMPEPFRTEHDLYLRTYLRTGRANIIGIGREVAGVRKDDTRFPIELAVSEVRVGNRRTFTGIVKDISERKQLEKMILEVSEREQQRIGHDLHDGLCQELTGITFLVQTIQKKHEGSKTVDASEFAWVTQLLGKAVQHARELSQGLYPVSPQPNGLRVALTQLTAATCDTFKIGCEFHCDPAVEMHDALVATHLYRIAQEAVRDAVRHGKARNVRIELAPPKDTITLTIDDDGIGPSKDGRFRTDMVLEMMQHRAKVIGAKLAIEPRKGGGVRVSCELQQSKLPTQEESHDNGNNENKARKRR